MKNERGNVLALLLIAVVVFALTAFISYRTGFGSGKAEEEAAWQVKESQYRAAETKLREDHAKELRQVNETHKQTNIKNAIDHENSVQKITDALVSARADADRRGGLRIPAPACPSGNVGADALAKGTGQRDEEATGTIALPERTQESLWSIVKQADDVVEQLRACQQWIRDSNMY